MLSIKPTWSSPKRPVRARTWCIAGASYGLGAGVSVEVLTTINAAATTAINLTGNELAQSIYGNNGDNIITSGGGADYLVGGAGNDVFVLSNAAITSPGPANISAIADYAAGDVIDVSQILAVAVGTDVIAGGYLRVTASGQVQVDVNGGGDTYVTVGTVNGSGSVTLRYLAGGVANDLGVARSGQASTGQSVMAGAIAAAGMAALVPADGTPDAKGGDHLAASALAMPAGPLAAEPTDHALTADGGLASLAFGAATGEAGSINLARFASIVGKDALGQSDHPVAVHEAAPPIALDQGTSLAVATTASQTLVAHAMVMPAAPLLAPGHGAGHGDFAASQEPHPALIAQVLHEALAGGAGSSPIDALLAALPGTTNAGNAADHLGHLAAVVDIAHGPAFAALLGSGAGSIATHRFRPRDIGTPPRRPPATA